MQTIETIGLAAGNAIQAPIQVAYREAFQNIVIPSFERATQDMFQQVNEAFVKGVRKSDFFFQQSIWTQTFKHTESRDPVISQLRKLTDSFQTSADSIRNQIISSVQSQFRTEMQASLQRHLEEAVMNLDVSNHVTRDHMKPVLFQLGQKLETYIVNHPNDKTTRSLKMLQMASESLLK